MISSPSSSLGVMICRRASWSMRSLASTSWPSTLPATVFLNRPGPMDWATSATETGPGNSRFEPSGSVMAIILGTPGILVGLPAAGPQGPGGCGRTQSGPESKKRGIRAALEGNRDEKKRAAAD